MSKIHPYAMETTTLGIMLWNPTSDPIDDMQYAGISLRLEPGEKQLFAIKCATHLLNAFGQRGLTSLTYGADEEKVGAAARERNEEFKKKQVIEYNQRNESRKQMGMGYLPPTPTVKQYAIDLGLQLLEPYSVRDEERNAISQTAAENKELRDKLTAQANEMAELKTMMQQLLAKKEPEKKEPESQLRVKRDGKWVRETTNPEQ